MRGIPRSEHPNPQFERADWMNLNGTWQFEIDNGRSGIARELFHDDVQLGGEILVPFCPESKLSGVEHKDFMLGVWYKRSFTLTEVQQNGTVLLHFGAVDYSCVVYINEKEAGRHTGGYVSFALDISHLVHEGQNTVAVYAEDDTRDPMIPRGKQSELYHSHGCDYTRTTGIWQTIWLEFLPTTHVRSVQFFPDSKNARITIKAQLAGAASLHAEVLYDGHPVGEGTLVSNGGEEILTIALCEKHLWEVGHGRLYSICFTYGEDIVCSYFGLRNIRLDGMRFLINEKSVFQRLVLDQGFYPDGIYTAPTDDALQNDIRLSMQMGFNGARLHEKIFEQRFLYYCDKMGYIVWGEYPDCGLSASRADAIYSLLPEWMEEINRDFNHPSIIGWCPRNETWNNPNQNALELIYRTTKAIDSTRPCIDTSGGVHTITDIFDVHDYDQNPVTMNERFEHLTNENKLVEWLSDRQTYRGEPVFVSEYGGIRWSDDQNAWGYGTAPKTKEDLIERFCGLTRALMACPKLFGLCYTQLTDVEQEQNGLYTYDRNLKFDPAPFHAVLSETAAIECENE